jgi:hypothetical protein
MVDERMQLTVHLERSGEGLRVGYYDTKAQRLGPDAAVEWTSIGAGFTYTRNGETMRGLDAINAALEQGHGDDLVHYFTQSRLVDVGHIFFDTLLGTTERWEPIIRKLFDEHGDPRPNPPRRGVRVRIYTTAHELIDLPWRLTAWEGKFLADSGWTFEVVSDVRASQPVDFDTPCPVLVIAPGFGSDDEVGSNEHVAALQQELPDQYLTQTHFRVVTTQRETRDAFLTMRPRVLYYYGHAEIRGGQLCLRIADPDTGLEVINALDLKRLMGGHFPHLAYINACRSGASGWHSVGYQLSPEVPVIIANATTAWSTHASRSAVAWLVKCLQQGNDPIMAAHEVDEHVTTRGFEWGMRTIHANYSEWRAQPLTGLGPIKPIGLRLNRDRVRERVLGRVAALVRDDDHRAMALVSYGKVGTRIDLSGQQLKDYLEDHAHHLAHISWRTVSFPVERPSSYALIERELERSLDATPGEPVEYALRRCARGLSVGGATPIVWLDWGVFGRNHGQILGQKELEIWVHYLGQLARHIPEDIRVIGYLAFETQATPHPQLEAIVDELALDHVTNEEFSVELVPPLEDISLLDVALFLQDRNNTRCPGNLVQEMARLLYQHTRGNYEQTIQLIERAEREGWHTMRRTLNPTVSADDLEGTIE